jgi:AcrR family transcriptional regulator
MKSGARRPASGAAKSRKAYHHGDLRHALMAATEAILLEKGVDAFTLREAARRAGVSPAAPAHHFGDAAGLLTAVAREGFAEFAAMLDEADKAAGPDPAARLKAQGKAYVTFALNSPARFQLMFRSDRLDPTRGDFEEVAGRSFATLENAVRDLVGLEPDAPMTADGYGALLATWSMVHGFSHLALGHELDRAAKPLGGSRAILAQMLPAMLRYLPDKPR